MGMMRLLDGTGDTIVEWQVDDETSVADAAELFLVLSAEKKLAFARSAGASADDAVLVRTFDPTAEEIIWVRPLAGG